MYRMVSLFLVMIVSVCVFGCGSQAVKPEAKDGTEQPKEQVYLNASTPIDIDDFVLKGIRLGDSTTSVVQKFNEPKAKFQKQDGLSYDYGDIEVIVNPQDMVINLLTDQATVATRRGIHPGSKISDVKTAYGENVSKMVVDDYELYEYSYTPAPNNSHILRFAVKSGADTVSYIGCRILAAVEVKQPQSGKISAGDLQGEWLADNGQWGLGLNLSVSEGSIVGRHDAWARGGNRLDVSLGKTSITGKFDGTSPVVINWTSGYSDVQGMAEITVVDANTLKWRITSAGTGEFWIPREVVLKRKK